MSRTGTLEKQLKEVRRVATHPEFIKVLMRIRQAPAQKRRAVLRRWARPSVFKKLGIPLAPGIKVTTRYFFEDQKVEGKLVTKLRGSRRGGATTRIAGICVCVGGGGCVGVGS